MSAKTLCHEIAHHFAEHIDTRQEHETIAESVAYIVLGLRWPTLLWLYRLANIVDLGSHEEARSIYGYLVGLAFSLGRAAFLTDTERGWGKILGSERGAPRLLETLL